MEQEWLLAKVDYIDENICDRCIFKKDEYYLVLSIVNDFAYVSHYEIVHDYDEIGNPSIIFVEERSRDKYFYSKQEIRKMKLAKLEL